MYVPHSWCYVLCKLEVCYLNEILTCGFQLDLSQLPPLTQIQESNYCPNKLVLEVNMPILLIDHLIDQALSPTLVYKKQIPAGLCNENHHMVNLFSS